MFPVKPCIAKLPPSRMKSAFIFTVPAAVDSARAKPVDPVFTTLKFPLNVPEVIAKEILASCPTELYVNLPKV